MYITIVMVDGKCFPMRSLHPVKRWSFREVGPPSLRSAGRGHRYKRACSSERRLRSAYWRLRAVDDGSVPSCPESYQVDLIRPPNQFALLCRLIQLVSAGFIFAGALLTEKIDRAVFGIGGDERAATKLEELLTSLGPSFIKLAQTLSMRPDLIGESYASTLSKMQDRVKPFSNVEAMQILEEELGKPLDEIFEYLSPNPLASASLGQVYKGVLRENLGGNCVAVKIQRPGAEELISVDIILLRRLLTVLKQLAGIKRDLRPLANDIGCALRGECDFRNEIANSEEFSKAHSSLPLVTVAPVVKELCTRRVVVSEWVNGKSPSQLIASEREHASDVLTMVNIGIQCSLTQLLVTGCMHGGKVQVSFSFCGEEVDYCDDLFRV